MSVSLDEHKLGGLRWIVLNGPDRETFGALGEHMRRELAGLTEAWPALPRLRRHVSGPPGRDLLAAVRRATAESFAAEWAELAAFADGAGVPFDDLALLNLRGDLGLVDGGIGCSDLAWRRERSVIAHNEDGAPEDVGRCGLLTLASGDRPPVTVFWYPGFLPANAFAVTGDGLVWTIDHLPVASPGPGAGRHFVGRGLVRSDPGPGGHGLTTLCTLVADLTAGKAVLAARGEQPVAIPLADLAEGDHRAQRPFPPAKF